MITPIQSKRLTTELCNYLKMFSTSLNCSEPEHHITKKTDGRTETSSTILCSAFAQTLSLPPGPYEPSLDIQKKMIHILLFLLIPLSTNFGSTFSGVKRESSSEEQKS